MPEKSSATESGFHFIQDYKRCKRYFMHKHVNGLESIYKSTALCFGASAHAAMETWYNLLRDGSDLEFRLEQSKKTFMENMQMYFDDYMDPEKFAMDMDRGNRILTEYALANPAENYKVVGVELPLEAELPSGDVLTGRIDLVVETNQGRRMIVDHKFTGWAMSNFSKSVMASDQATAYKFLWEANYPDVPINTITFNICRGTKTQTEFRQVSVFKTRDDVKEYILDTTEELNEMASRISDSAARWPKNTEACFMYNKPCAFLELCQGENFDSLIGVKFVKRQ